MNDKIIFFKTQKDFRKWLEKNHEKEKEQWVGFYKKGSGKKSIDWPQSVDEALCFGWIDGLRKSIDEESYMIRFTPRRKKSNWSAINLKRAAELTKMGLMHPNGLKIYNERDENNAAQYSYENRNQGLSESYETKFKLNKKAWKFFNSQAPWYQKTAAYWVMSAKREETRVKRLQTLIDDSANQNLIKQMIKPVKNGD